MIYKPIKFSGIYDTRVSRPQRWSDQLFISVATDFRLAIPAESIEWALRFMVVPYEQ
jgi:hypothetical protein